MKHHKYNKDFKFVVEPMEFNKYTEKELLQYCLGATLYMPSKKDIVNKIINKEIEGLTTMVMCFEDAIREEDLVQAQDNVIDILDTLSNCLENGTLTQNDIPLYFLRVRNQKQFRAFSNRLKKKHYKVLTGFIFPKFCSKNGHEYLNILEELNNKYEEIIYGMPILESEEIIYKENRINELVAIQSMLYSYKDYILNVRVGATDFSSKFGVRRGINYNVYDINVIADCLSDILNFFNREGQDYVVSAPVWEYFSQENFNKVATQQPFNIHKFLLRRKSIVNDAIDGLLREVALDKANGFVGKTIIHPTHLKFVNALQAVTLEEYEDALMVIDNQGGGVLKGANGNKMNETNPHLNWAKKTLLRAKAYGVIENNDSYTRLFLG